MLVDVDTTSSTLLDDLVEAQRLNAQSLQRPHLASAVAALSAAVGAHATVVAASSREGERLLGALLVSLPSVRCWQPGDAAVTLIDGYVAGAAGIHDAALKMRRMGTEDVRSVVLGHTGAALTAPGVEVKVATPQQPLAAVASRLTPRRVG